MRHFAGTRMTGPTFIQPSQGPFGLTGVATARAGSASNENEGRYGAVFCIARLSPTQFAGHKEMVMVYVQ